MHFSPECLRIARNQARLTQEELAKRAGVSLRSIINWEKGVEPSNANLRKICNALQVDFAHFFVSDETGHALRESPPEGEMAMWKRRALQAERQLNELRNGMRALLELTSPASREAEPKGAPASSLGAQVSKADVEAALNERKK